MNTGLRASKLKQGGIRRDNASHEASKCGIVGAFFRQTVMKHRESLKELLRRKSVFQGGEFTLSSGQKSNYYIDCKLTTLDPEGAVLTGYTILELLKDSGIRADAIGGLTMGADPIVTAVAAVSYLERDPLPGFLIRKRRKEHGREKQIEGIDENKSWKVVIVDEVCTTGDSTFEAIELAEQQGLQVVAVVSLVDREEGGSKRLRGKYPYFRVFTARELLDGDQQRAPGSEKTADDTGQSTTGNPRPA